MAIVGRYQTRSSTNKHLLHVSRRILEVGGMRPSRQRHNDWVVVDDPKDTWGAHGEAHHVKHIHVPQKLGDSENVKHNTRSGISE